MKAGRDGGGRSESRVEVGRSRAVAVEGASDRDGDRATVNERGDRWIERGRCRAAV